MTNSEKTALLKKLAKRAESPCRECGEFSEHGAGTVCNYCEQAKRNMDYNAHGVLWLEGWDGWLKSKLG